MFNIYKAMNKGNDDFWAISGRNALISAGWVLLILEDCGNNRR